ncbi:hypothetical protein, conserved [Eimeria brunetti]|uniref:protein-histidine N-methyltransferase n=1 Tax=Eimeria brunetti TaxID=51314 RepID=U6L6P7_9EIME|nr:hypothetical protein, conserved [Eimeria brunetti]
MKKRAPGRSNTENKTSTFSYSRVIQFIGDMKPHLLLDANPQPFTQAQGPPRCEEMALSYPKKTMAFPEDWGPPPQFAAVRVTAEGVPLSIHTKPVSSAANTEDSICSTTAMQEENLNEDGPTDDHAGDDATVFYAVKGCPTASNDMLVKKGEYEGGFSIWECTWDILGFLQNTDKEQASQVRALVASGHVLDLGCGHGLLGIWALKSGASAVVFQDLNLDVLNLATRWNILKNSEGGRRGDASPHHHELSVSVHGAFLSPAAASSGNTETAFTEYVRNPIEGEGHTQRKYGGSFSLLQGRALCVAASWEKYPQICCSCQRARTNAAAEVEANGETQNDPNGPSEGIHKREQSAVTALGEKRMATDTARQSDAREIQFTVIFSSEGIYREETFEPLAELFKRLLRKDGIALVASKR